jgi:AraC-like DNA-binding protein
MVATVAASLVRPILRTWALPRQEVDRILGRGGVSRADLDDFSARIEHDVLVDLVDLAVRTTGNERLGLHDAMFAGGRLVSQVDHLLGLSGSAGEALETISRYSALVHDGLRLWVAPEGERTAVHVGFAEGLRCPNVLIDFAVASLFIIGRGMHVSKDQVEVFFTYPEPPDTTEYHRLFRVPVHFGAASSYVVVPTAALKRRIFDREAAAFAELQHCTERFVRTHGGGEGLSSRVSKLMAAGLRGGRATEVWVAEQLAMTPRTLRRRLANEGTSFLALMEAVRSELALRYVRERDFDPDHAAFLLGFSDARVLRRAVKRWTGQSLRELRSMSQVSTYSG